MLKTCARYGKYGGDCIKARKILKNTLLSYRVNYEYIRVIPEACEYHCNQSKVDFYGAINDINLIFPCK